MCAFEGAPFGRLSDNLFWGSHLACPQDLEIPGEPFGKVGFEQLSHPLGDLSSPQPISLAGAPHLHSCQHLPHQARPQRVPGRGGPQQVLANTFARPEASTRQPPTAGRNTRIHGKTEKRAAPSNYPGVDCGSGWAAR